MSEQEQKIDQESVEAQTFIVPRNWHRQSKCGHPRIFYNVKGAYYEYDCDCGMSFKLEMYFK